MRPGRFAPLLALLAAMLGACSFAAPNATPAVQTVIVERTVQVPRDESARPTARPLPTIRPGAKVVLRVGTGDSGLGLTPHLQIIEQFEKANPDIQVQLEPVGSGNYYERVMTQIEGGDPPDILQIGDDAVPMFVQRGALIPLDALIHSADYPLDPSIYLPGVFAPGAWDGQQYLLPKDFSPLAVYYNKKIFDQYGVPHPQEGWTQADFLATARALTRDSDGDGTTDIWGVQLPGAWTSGFEYWVAAAGGRLISEDGRQFVGHMDAPQVVEAMRLYAGLYNKDKVAPLPTNMDMFGGGNTEFEDGKAAMRIFGRWPQSTLRENTEVDLGVVGMPAGAQRANILLWSGFGISSLSTRQQEAWRFLRFYAGEQGAAIWKNWGLPTVTSVAEQSGQVRDPIEGPWLRELEHLTPRGYTSTPYWGSTAEPALQPVLEKAIFDPNLDIQAALTRAAQQAQRALERQ